MPDTDVLAEALALIELVARAIRDELGAEIDAYPGAHAPEHADPLNRAFRAVAAALLKRDAADRAVPPARVSQILRRVAERRLARDGWTDRQVRRLIDDEPGGPDDWLAFLVLSSRRQVEDALKPDEPDRA